MLGLTATTTLSTLDDLRPGQTVRPEDGGTTRPPIPELSKDAFAGLSSDTHGFYKDQVGSTTDAGTSSGRWSSSTESGSGGSSDIGPADSVSEAARGASALPIARQRHSPVAMMVSPPRAERPARHRPIVSDGLAAPEVRHPPDRFGSPADTSSTDVWPSVMHPVSPWGPRGPKTVFAALRSAPDAPSLELPLLPLPWPDEPLSPQAVAEDLRELQRSHQREIAELANRAARAALDMRESRCD